MEAAMPGLTTENALSTASAGVAIERFGSLVGSSPAMKQVFAIIAKAAKIDMSVLIVGETGTGKELVAREIHARGRRKERPFVAVNTGAMSTQLVASELFGHVKGSFTGAVDNKTGRFAEADGGTLFLDEIATMEERVQITLLRVLETDSFRPIGGKTDKKVDVRLIAATNVDLRQVVDAGQFREDLLHRLQVFLIFIPPLREHPADLPMLVQHFLDMITREFHLNVEGISKEALDALAMYPWPGNVRELKNVIAQAAVMAEEGILLPEHLPPRIQFPQSTRQRVPSALQRPAGDPILLEPTRDPGAAPKEGNGNEYQQGVFMPLGASLEEVQKAYVLKTLAYCSHNKTHAAKMLGVSRKTLYDRLLRWGVGT